jgi:hypothetical protein
MRATIAYTSARIVLLVVSLILLYLVGARAAAIRAGLCDERNRQLRAAVQVGALPFAHIS